ILRLAAGIIQIYRGLSYLTGLSEPSEIFTRSMFGPSALSLIFIIGGLLLLLGLLTPMAGTVLTVGNLSAAVLRLMDCNPVEGANGPLLLLLIASITGALALLGPGAFSLDAHLFGRRRITIFPKQTTNPDSRTWTGV